MEQKASFVTILTAYVLESSEEEDEAQHKRRKIWTKDWVTRRQQEFFVRKIACRTTC